MPKPYCPLHKMSHLLGLRAATAVGAHLSTYRGGWGSAFFSLRRQAFSAVLGTLPRAPPELDLFPLNAAALLRRVERAATLPDAALEAFRLFASDLEAVAPKFSFWARCLTRLAVEGHLRSHSVLHADLERHPEILETPLRAPVFVVGLPRTGTTLLHHLLALDPEAQCLRAFELMRPARSLDSVVPSQIVDLIDWARLSILLRLVAWIAPQWPHHHSLDANSPEECIFALQRSMPLDTHYKASPELPTVYASEGSIPAAAYEGYREFLQQVQVRRDSVERRYVLKGQLLHLQFLEHLRTAFPTAQVVWTHRPAAEVVGSLCSLRRSQHEVLLQGPVDHHKIGHGVLEYLSTALVRAGAALGKDSQAPQKEAGTATPPLLHVQYEALVNDPVSVVEAIYENWGWEVKPAHREAMERYLQQSYAERRKDGHGRKRYHDASLGRYGLSREQVHVHFATRGSMVRRFADMRSAFEGSKGVLPHSNQLFAR